MSNLQKIFEEEEEEFDKKLIEFSDDVITIGFGGDELNGYKGKFNKEAEFLRTKDYSEAKNRLKSFIQLHSAKIIKVVCEEMTGKEKDLFNDDGLSCEWKKGYDYRIQEEIETAKQLNDNLCSENQNPNQTL